MLVITWKRFCWEADLLFFPIKWVIYYCVNNTDITHTLVVTTSEGPLWSMVTWTFRFWFTTWPQCTCWRQVCTNCICLAKWFLVIDGCCSPPSSVHDAVAYSTKAASRQDKITWNAAFTQLCQLHARVRVHTSVCSHSEGIFTPSKWKHLRGELASMPPSSII